MTPNGRVEGACLSLGSNQGDRRLLLASALRALSELDRTRVAAVSSVYESDPVGRGGQPAYLNMAVRLETALSAEALVLSCQAIERRNGRNRLLETAPWGPRPLDMDVILFGPMAFRSLVATIPHPRYKERLFVLEPLLEICPGLACPVTGEPLAALADDLRRSQRCLRVGAADGVQSPQIGNPETVSGHVADEAGVRPLP